MPKMEDYTLKAICESKLVNALGWVGGRLSKERILATAYYQGEPFGNEQEGRSRVISRDVAEAVDSVMPGIVKVFASTDEVVIFNPRRQADEPAAAQATDYVNWVFQHQDDWFDTLQMWTKDGLLYKLGLVKSWWDEQEDVRTEEYFDLTPYQYRVLISDPNVEIVAAQIKFLTAQPIDPNQPQLGALPTAAAPQAAAPGPQGAPQMNPGALPPTPANVPGGIVPPQMPEPQPAPELPELVPIDAAGIVYDCTLKRTNKSGRIRIACIPPEEFLTDRRAVSLREATFCAHRAQRTVTDLIEMGYDAEVVNRLQGGDELDYNTEVLERFHKEDEMPQRDQVDNLDPTMRKVWVAECYTKVDYDGDGVAEWRKVVLGGSTALEILENEECEGHPFSAWTPNKMPHKLYGESLADKTMDLQLIKSTVWRQVMDASYYSLSPELAIVEGQVNVEDVLTRRPGGAIRMRGQGMVMPIPTQDTSVSGLNLLNYVDGVREARTGVRRFSPSTDPDTINPYNATATGARIIEDGSQDRIQLMARNLAEQGLKPLCKRVFELTCKHQDKPMTIRLRGKWVDIDPSTWATDMDMQVKVGLGTGNRDTQVQHLMSLMQIDQQIVQAQGGLNGPVLTIANIYEQVKALQEAQGFRGHNFFTDPSTQAPRPAPPHPEQVKAQGDVQKIQAQSAADIALERAKAGLNVQANQQERQVRAATEIQISREKAAIEAQLARERLASDDAFRRDQLAAHERIEMARMAHASMNRAAPQGVM